MTARSWWSHRVGRTPMRIIASPTGLRPAVRTKHLQVSTRSAFVKAAGFKMFLTPNRGRR